MIIFFFMPESECIVNMLQFFFIHSFVHEKFVFRVVFVTVKGVRVQVWLPVSFQSLFFVQILFKSGTNNRSFGSCGFTAQDTLILFSQVAVTLTVQSHHRRVPFS